MYNCSSTYFWQGRFLQASSYAGLAWTRQISSSSGWPNDWQMPMCCPSNLLLVPLMYLLTANREMQRWPLRAAQGTALNPGMCTTWANAALKGKDCLHRMLRHPSSAEVGK